MQQTPERIGPYRLTGLLGRGGMGVVYRARQEPGGAAVALKTVRVPDAGGLHNIRREIYALAQLRHPGIVRILDEGLHEGMPWYAMELLEGVTLHDWRIGAGAPGAGSGAPPALEIAPEWWTRSLERPEAPESRDTTSFELPPSQRALVEEPRPAPLRPALGLVRRLCASLSYLHGEGLVHRDLKPENILIKNSESGILNFELELQQNERQTIQNPRSGIQNSKFKIQNSPWPVIVDFGLASRSGGGPSRDALEVAGLVSGTAAYMAPEQGRGELVDARADLYALGCILYELVTGRPPFVGWSLMQVLHQHFEAQPEVPSRLRPEIPPELDELILRLLEKEPRNRLGYADDVAAALSRLGIDEEPAASAPAARAYLYRPGFSGRQGVLDQLQEQLSALRTGTGAVVLIGGESGVGKTRLLVELSRLASRDRLRVLTGECPPPAMSGEQRAASATRDAGSPASGGSPLQAFRKVLQAIADICRERGPQETERLLGRRGKVLAGYVPELAGLPGQDRSAAAQDIAPLPADAARVRLFSYLAETLAALAAGPQSAGSQSPPLLVLLDDLQWADELSLGALEFLVRSCSRAQMPLLLVGVYRSEEVGPALRRLVEDAGVRALKLERLGGGAVGRIVADMLGLKSLPESFSRFLLEQSEGNPFFVAEVLRAAVGQNLLYRDEDGHWQVAEPLEATAVAPDGTRPPAHLHALHLPNSLLELISERLSRLGADTQQLVEALSVLGREADGAVLAEVSGLRSSRVMKATLEALNRQVLETSEDEGLRFVHDKLREVAYGRISAERRRELHRAAAEALEEALATQGEKVLEALGHHWEQAADPDKARPRYLGAAQQAVRRHAHEKAERLYTAYLRLASEPTPESVEARLDLGEKVLHLQGLNDRALEQLRLALSEARQAGAPKLEGRILGAMGRVHIMTGRSDEARQFYEQALELHRRSGDRQEEGAILGNLANVDFRQGRIEEARQRYEQAVDMARQVGSRQGEGISLGNLANLHHAQGRLEEARQQFGLALELLRQAEHLPGVGGVLGNLAVLSRQQGRLEEARRHSEQALELLRQVGDRQGEGIALSNLALLHQEQGRLQQARQSYQQALELLRQASARHTEGHVLDNLASLYREEGRIEEALELTEQARGLLAGQPYEGRALGHLALLHQEQGRLDEAHRLYEEALRFLRQIGDPRNEGIVLGNHASLFQEEGRLAEALELYERALRLHRQFDNPRIEGRTLGRLAELELLRTGDVKRAKERLEQGARLLTEVGDRFELGKLLCRWGHVAVASGTGGRELLGRVEALAEELDAAPGSELARKLSGLRRAVAASEAGEQGRLFRGQLVEEIPAGLLRALRESGELQDR